MQRLSQSPSDDAFLQDPYPFYARARSLGPLFFWEDYGLTVISHYAEVNALLRDRRLGRQPPTPPSSPADLAPFYAVEAHSLLELEPPSHTRLRRLVLHAFTRRRVGAMGPEIEALCHAHIDAFPDGPFDLITAYAKPIPALIIARLLGVPDDRAPDLLEWSNAMVKMYQAGRNAEDEAAAIQATRDFVAYLDTLIDARRTAPRDDLLSEMIAAEEEGERLSRAEMISTAILLLNAGHEATVHTLGNGVRLLLKTGHKPTGDVAGLVEEILRYDPPLHMFTRHVYEEVEVGGLTLRPGQQVGLLLGAAGRDSQIYKEAERFQPDRFGAKTSLAFGAGLHFCLGVTLARLELEISLRVLFHRCPNLRLAGTPRFADIYHFHGLESLWVET
ncbi:MAG: cytochrome P450 [Pseudomonadota bacterium]